jgi:beta-glucosidase
MAKFPKGFMLGAATAAHQAEGNNIHSDVWALENLTHSMYAEPSGAAVDHYNRYEEDIALLANAGLNAYRFSIEWARIQPTQNEWRDDEIEHYRKVLACCRKNGITPVVTMHHFSSPKWLIESGGWEEPGTVSYFAAYCKRVAENLGDLMEYVCTINEANMGLQIAKLMQDMGKRSANDVQVGVEMPDPNNAMLSMMEAGEAFGCDPRNLNTFISVRTPDGDKLVMQAHEAARDAMKSVCPHLKVGLTFSLHDMQPTGGGEANAAQEWDEEFAHYLYAIKNDDFLGIQCYTRKIIDAGGTVQSDDAPKTQMGYENYPQAIANAVRTVSKDFSGELIVTENGIATSDDVCRVEFIKEATDGIAACIADGLNVKGYFYWSLLDNFEWMLGFSKTFGLIRVDRTTQKRYPKESLAYLGSLNA